MTCLLDWAQSVRYLISLHWSIMCTALYSQRQKPSVKPAAHSSPPAAHQLGLPPDWSPLLSSLKYFNLHFSNRVRWTVLYLLSFFKNKRQIWVERCGFVLSTGIYIVCTCVQGIIRSERQFPRLWAGPGRAPPSTRAFDSTWCGVKRMMGSQRGGQTYC